MTPSEAGHKLDAMLRGRVGFIAVGVGGDKHGAILYVYYEPPALAWAKDLVMLGSKGYEGFPVIVVETTKPVPAGEGK